MKNLVKVERARLNLTQEQLAKRLGVSRQTINAIEKSKFNPSVVLAIKMAKLFNLTVEEVFFLEGE
ncbi:helix-turn-helix transcriptional regulator [Muricauda sp. SCSIO 64092]|uniref:helix-turn-helix transcriptional regulator n=1 Tax=Allomuricauda sp. SCSIO 64092 TaxID=2908842 RepID=UPI00131D347E|nr:helix-turn-helix transcriptional regulator [Muricauda sp. SCSIO 64092]UOY09074.1 helix-turn-helix transcriptional regulator [Muricauda sp. SCSIO 64092]